MLDRAARKHERERVRKHQERVSALRERRRNERKRKRAEQNDQTAKFALFRFPRADEYDAPNCERDSAQARKQSNDVHNDRRNRVHAAAANEERIRHRPGVCRRAARIPSCKIVRRKQENIHLRGSGIIEQLDRKIIHRNEEYERKEERAHDEARRKRSRRHRRFVAVFRKHRHHFFFPFGGGKFFRPASAPIGKRPFFRLRFFDRKIEIVSARFPLAHDPRRKQPDHAQNGDQERAVHADCRRAAQTGNDERQRTQHVRRLHAAGIERVAGVQRSNEEEYAEHQRRAQMPQPEREIAKRVNERECKPRLFAFEQCFCKEITEHEYAERGEHREETQPERTHAEDQRAEREYARAQRIVHGIAVVDVLFRIGIAETHFRNRRHNSALFGRKTAERRLRRIRHLLFVNERARAPFCGFVGFVVIRRCGINLRGNHVKFPRSLAVGRSEFFAHEHDFVYENVVRRRGKTVIRITLHLVPVCGIFYDLFVERRNPVELRVFHGGAFLVLFHGRGRQIFQHRRPLIRGGRTERIGRSAAVQTDAHVFARAAVQRADVHVDVFQRKIRRFGRTVRLLAYGVGKTEHDVGIFVLFRGSKKFVRLSRGNRRAERSQTERQKYEREREKRDQICR